MRDKSRNLTKNCMKLKELGVLWEKFWKVKKYFFKNISLGGTNKLKCVEKTKKSVNYRSPTIRDGRVIDKKKSTKNRKAAYNSSKVRQHINVHKKRC